MHKSCDRQKYHNCSSGAFGTRCESIQSTATPTPNGKRCTTTEAEHSTARKLGGTAVRQHVDSSTNQSALAMPTQKMLKVQCLTYNSGAHALRYGLHLTTRHHNGPLLWCLPFFVVDHVTAVMWWPWSPQYGRAHSLLAFPIQLRLCGAQKRLKSNCEGPGTKFALTYFNHWMYIAQTANNNDKIPQWQYS